MVERLGKADLAGVNREGEDLLQLLLKPTLAPPRRHPWLWACPWRPPPPSDTTERDAVCAVCVPPHATMKAISGLYHV